MADYVKMRKRNVLVPLIGDRVSVDRCFFDTDNFKYSETLPESFERLVGTVIAKEPGKARVSFDIDNDGSFCYVFFGDLKIEDINTGKQIDMVVETHDIDIGKQADMVVEMHDSPARKCKKVDYNELSETEDGHEECEQKKGDKNEHILKKQIRQIRKKPTKKTRNIVNKERVVQADPSTNHESDFEEEVETEDGHEECEEECGENDNILKVKILSKKFQAKVKAKKQTRQTTKKPIKQKRKTVKKQQAGQADPITNQESDVENVLDYEEEVEDEVSEEDKLTKEKLAEEKTLWKKGGWHVDPRQINSYGPRLCNTIQGDMNEVGMFFHFLPMQHVKEVMVPAMSNINVTFEELITFFSILKSMEVQKLPERRMYWMIIDLDMFKALNYGRYR